MRFSGISRGVFLSIVCSGAAYAQTLPTAARIESIPLELTMPERYKVLEVLEPIRKVTLVAAGDGLIRSMEGRLGSVIRETEEIAQIDRTEATAKLKMATADLHEKQALVKTDKVLADVYQAQVEAAAARVELAQIELDRCTLRSTFFGPAGRTKCMRRPICDKRYGDC